MTDREIIKATLLRTIKKFFTFTDTPDEEILDMMIFDIYKAAKTRMGQSSDIYWKAFLHALRENLIEDFNRERKKDDVEVMEFPKALKNPDPDGKKIPIKDMVTPVGAPTPLPPYPFIVVTY